MADRKVTPSTFERITPLDTPALSEEERAQIATVDAALDALGTAIAASVPEGRNKSLAYTSLETVADRAYRGIVGQGGAR